MEQIISCLNSHFFSVASRIVAGYFFWVLHLHVGFPPMEPLTPTSAAYLTLSLLFLVLPYAQRLRVGRLVEFEAKVKQVQTDVREVRSEAREILTTVSVLANAVSATMNQSVVVNVPSQEEGRAARDELMKAVTHPPPPTSRDDSIREYLGSDDLALPYGLARLRIDLERQLRRILGKRLASGGPGGVRVKFLPVRSLFRQLVAVEPRYGAMQESVGYLLEVCNAAMHGQRISERVAYEAIDMGLYILRELENEKER